MTYPSRISKTKRRLSDDRWAVTTVACALLGLFAILTFGLRAVTLSGVYGVVPLEMPVVPATIKDPGHYGFREEPRETLTHNTPAVVLTTDAFYFGDLASFTTNFADVRDKYVIRHVDGEPQLAALVDALGHWATDRSKHQNIPLNKILVLVPAGDIPMPIVIQVVAGLRKSPLFERVVLGSGLM
jgi:hypothetical protein